MCELWRESGGGNQQRCCKSQLSGSQSRKSTQYGYELSVLMYFFLAGSERPEGGEIAPVLPPARSGRRTGTLPVTKDWLLPATGVWGRLPAKSTPQPPSCPPCASHWASRRHRRLPRRRPPPQRLLPPQRPSTAAAAAAAAAAALTPTASAWPWECP